MSIKKLFDNSANNNRLSPTNKKNTYNEAESADNVVATRANQERFVPNIDYSDPANFVTYGSARLYYKSALTRISDYYPYDGSSFEKNKFLNESLDIEKYIFDRLYPTSTGYATFARNGYAVSSISSDGYGVPTSNEYIDFKGGPGTGSATSLLMKDLMPNPHNSKNDNSNLYDENIYRTAGLPNNYGKGTRTSNLRANFDDGVTVEFWLKSGSIADTITKKQVVFDMWNNNASTAVDYGRIRIDLTGSSTVSSPFLLTVQSGSDSISEQEIGAVSLHENMGDWNHYAFTMQNSGSSFVMQLYVNGIFNASASVNDHGYSSIGELPTKDMVARLGALITSPSGSSAAAGSGRLSGSIDEFRYWKVKRSSKQIGTNWFTQINGGSNSDVHNADLGIYYKFNEGVTGDSATDSIVLDYSGRATNGVWTGYSSNSRNTGSAIVSASAAAKETEDPIIRVNHPRYTSLRNSLIQTGSSYDYNNNASLMSLTPGWVQDLEAENENSDLRYITHVMGAYLDKLKLQISEVPNIKLASYPSASHKPYPIAEHFPQSLGMYMPELFVDSTVLEKFLNRNEDTLFESDLEDTKNIIYQNLYNNLAHIYKSKGTEKAIRNVLRCFNLDDDTISFRIFSDNEEFELRNNLVQRLVDKKFINFNTVNNSKAVIYNASASLPDVIFRPWGSGSIVGQLRGADPQKGYGLTYEANILFPSFTNDYTEFVRDHNYNKVSLFGFVHTDGNTANKLSGQDTVTAADDRATLKMYAIRDRTASKNVKFQLESMFTSGSNNFTLTSDTFFDVYDDEMWNLSVRIEPQKFGSQFITGAINDQSYNVIFSGFNPQAAGVYNSFSVSSSLSSSVAQDIIKLRKRPYIGADRNDLTGSVIYRTDIYAGSVAYYLKKISDDELLQHAFDVENVGLTGSYEQISPFDTTIQNSDVTNNDLLALNWNFNNISSSNASGRITVLDYSSGSAEKTGSMGWAGAISGYVRTGVGRFFENNDTTVAETKKINTFKFIDPEQVVATDMVQLFSDEDEMFPNLRRSEIVPNYVYSLEKSIYASITEQMLDFFAGANDFNNIIGRPVNKYRSRYKEIEKLRETFFRRVKHVSTVEKYVNYYKWFDESISQIISQLLPASSEFAENISNVIESHVLERNKYRNILPIVDSYQFYKTPTLADPTVVKAGGELFVGPDETSLDVIPASPRPVSRGKNYWKKRVKRTDQDITSGDSTIDTQREKFRQVINTRPYRSSSLGLPKLQTTDGTRYEGGKFSNRNYGSVEKISIDSSITAPKPFTLKSGLNSNTNKWLDYTLTAVRPAGPVNKENNVFVPLNVLVAFTSESVATTNFIEKSWPQDLVRKENKIFKVQHGRDWQEGLGYKNVKSTFAFPFTIKSSSVEVSTGYNKEVVNKVARNLEITNMHIDSYGSQNEVPMQGTFTYDVVGGHQSRHIGLNDGTNSPETRAEAWRILLGTCGTDSLPSGAIGLVGPDYPPADYNPPAGTVPYPYTAHQKAYLYRDHIAKRPVNIRNITQKFNNNTVVGNYQNQYEVIHTFGATANPRKFIDNQPILPDQLSNITGTTNVRTFLSRHRGEQNHATYVDEYSTSYLTGTINKTVITNRFSAPGGIEVQTRGYQDFKASEYSVYNVLGLRNLSVIKPQQGPSGSISEPHGGTPSTSRAFDIHGKDYGLNSHYARHTAKFGRDSLFVSTPGTSYNQLPGFHKTHRNRAERVELSGSREITVNTNKDISNTYGIMFSGSSGVNQQSAHLKHSGSFKDSDGSTWSGKTFTLSTWLYMQAGQSNTRAILTLGDVAATVGPSANRALLWGLDSSERPQFWIQTSTGNRCKWRQNDDLDNNEWYHLAVTYDGSDAANEPAFYMNGVSQSMTRYNGSMSSSMQSINEHGVDSNSYIGGFNDTGTAYNPLNKTALDEMAIYDVVFTPAQITTLYASGGILNLTSAIAPNTSSLATWIRFGDVSGDPTDTALMTQSAGFGPRFFDKMGNNNFDIRASKTNINALLISSSLPNHPDVLPTASILQVTTENVYLTKSVFDNLYVSRPIPRSDRQYMWISRSAIGAEHVKYAGYQNTYREDMKPFRTSSAGLEEYWTFTSASDATTGSFYQPANRLNIVLIDPVDDDNATLGSATVEINEDLVGAAPATLNPDYLNQLLNKRGLNYGWGWNKLHQNDHPLLRKQRRENELIIQRKANDLTLTKYSLPPVSLKGRPMLVNIGKSIITGGGTGSSGQRVSANATFKVTNTNELIRFNQFDLNELANIDYNKLYRSRRALFDHSDGSKGAGKSVNWVLYSQNIFPSIRNEFVSGTERPNYENNYWRDVRGTDIDINHDSKTSRLDLGIVNVTTNSFGYTEYSQSAWLLDPDPAFLTRTTAYYSKLGQKNLTVLAPAGELQNHDYRYLVIRSNTSDPKIANYSKIAAQYSRCHTLDTINSVVSPYGPQIAETGSTTFYSASFEPANKLEIFGSGEALWEAGQNAGFNIIDTTVSGGMRFVSASSQPWWNDYNSFKENLNLKAKGFAIIPEFRISEHINEYEKIGTQTKRKTGINTFEIPGTGINSSNTNFYKDYSNSDFLQEFLNVRKETLLSATEIRLSCTGAIRYNTYKGFYPAQRTLDLVSQFSRSFADAFSVSQSATTNRLAIGAGSLVIKTAPGYGKLITDSVFSPGILYNSIKSGIAVDYPLVHDGTILKYAHYGDDNGGGSNNYAITITGSIGSGTTNGSSEFKVASASQGYHGGQFWNRRLPFEAIIRPKSFLPGYSYQSLESHPSMSLTRHFPGTASMSDIGDGVYNLMARNFFGETAKFFLNENNLTTLKSNTVTNDLQFSEGEVYMSRIKLRRSHNGERTYQHEHDSFGLRMGQAGNNGEWGKGVIGVAGLNSFYSTNGCRAYLSASDSNFNSATYGNPAFGGRGKPLVLQTEFPLPQDPMMNPDFKETFTLYSRPSAFGPPVAGRPTGSFSTRNIIASGSENEPLQGFFTASFEKSAHDSFVGINPAFTPPYYDGEAWVDLIFRPQAGIAYDLERILAETKTYSWRFDTGPQIQISGSDSFRAKMPKPGFPALVPVQMRENTNAGLINQQSPNDDNTIPSPYDGLRINVNSMQLTSSIDIFGVERVLEESQGNGLTNKTVGQKWLIRPKWETPMLNFSDTNANTNPINAANGTLTIPNFASESVPRGIWHQFGTLPSSDKVGIFMEINEIPLQWLNNHYLVTHTGSVYNNFDKTQATATVKNVKSLAKLCGFNRTNNEKRLGEIKDKLEVFEAIVAIPYVTVPSNKKSNAKLKSSNRIIETNKKFVTIPKTQWNSAIKGIVSSQDNNAGNSIRTLVAAMDKYVFPPEFDCLHNTKVKPVAMYVFEFKYEFDKDDLSYIWQNMAPRDYKKLDFQTSTVTHNLSENELIDGDILNNENLRWMVFKVKQRARTDYYDLLVDQAGEATRQIDNTKPRPREYPLQFNWPYDYLSFVELIKMDVDILFKK